MHGKQFDALVIGSGAAGSFAAKELTQRGLEVLLLEAGPNISEDDFKVPDVPQQKGINLKSRVLAVLRGQHIQARLGYFGEQFKHLFVNDRENPYTTPPDNFYLWIRGRQLGGRLHLYGRVLLRMSDYDFKGASRDGCGEDWPISYADIAPYYDRVEEFMGLYGTKDHIRNLPDGKCCNLPKLTAVEQAFKANVEATWPDRSVISWRYAAPNLKRAPLPILAAKETGRLTIRTDAIVKRINVDPASGRATGAEFIDRRTRKTESVSADVVVLCASTIESVRLLLNSACPKYPNGLANSNGLLAVTSWTNAQVKFTEQCQERWGRNKTTQHRMIPSMGLLVAFTCLDSIISTLSQIRSSKEASHFRGRSEEAQFPKMTRPSLESWDLVRRSPTSKTVSP